MVVSPNVMGTRLPGAQRLVLFKTWASCGFET